jgi:hypothetical protein
MTLMIGLHQKNVGQDSVSGTVGSIVLFTTKNHIETEQFIKYSKITAVEIFPERFNIIRLSSFVSLIL